MTEVKDPNELVYVEHDDGDGETIDQGAWVPRSSLRQHALSNWFEATPPDKSLKTTQIIAAMTQDNDHDPSELVEIYHPELKATAMCPLSAVPQHSLSGWHIAGAAQTVDEVRDGGEFDPDDHSYREVIERLKTADDAERARIIAIEKASASPRKSITDWQPPAGGNSTDVKDES